MSDKIEIPKQFLKDLYDIKGVPALKAALEKNFGEVVRPIPEPVNHNQIWILQSGRAGLLTYAGGGDLKIVYLDGYGWDPITALAGSRLMLNGKVITDIRNGKVAGAEVQEEVAT